MENEINKYASEFAKLVDGKIIEHQDLTIVEFNKAGKFFFAAWIANEQFPTHRYVFPTNELRERCLRVLIALRWKMSKQYN